MPVAASWNRPASARTRTPSKTCTAVRVETARATTPSLVFSSSREHVAFRPDPTITSVSII